MADNDARWYVIHTYSGYEKKVAASIRTLAENRRWTDRIIDVCVPTETVKKITPNSDFEASDIDADVVSDSAKKSTRKKNAQKDEEERIIFYGYVFVKIATKVSKADEINNDAEEDEFKIDDDVWYGIRTTRGVTGFVGPDGKLVPLDKEDLIKFKIEQFEEDEISVDDDFYDPSMDFFNSMPTIELDYKVGDRVKVLNMPGFSGIVKEIDIEHNLVIVVGSMFGGRETPVEVELDQVELVED